MCLLSLPLAQMWLFFKLWARDGVVKRIVAETFQQGALLAKPPLTMPSSRTLAQVAAGCSHARRASPRLPPARPLLASHSLLALILCRRVEGLGRTALQGSCLMGPSRRK